jgi:hypothetical protein
VSFRILETVLCATPAAFAMSFIVAGRFRVVSFSPRTLMTADPGRNERLLSSAHLACS